MFNILKRMKSFTNNNISIIFKPCKKWQDIGNWNDFKNIGKTFNIRLR